MSKNIDLSAQTTLLHSESITPHDPALMTVISRITMLTNILGSVLLAEESFGYR